MSKKKIIELPEQATIKNIQPLFDTLLSDLNGKQKILIKGHLMSCDLTMAQVILQLRKDYSERIEFDFSIENEIEILLSKAGIKLQ